MNEVWIRGLYYSLVFVLIEKNDISNTQDNPSTSNFIKNTLLHIIFDSQFAVFGYADETLSLVFDIILKKPQQQKGKPF